MPQRLVPQICPTCHRPMAWIASHLARQNVAPVHNAPWGDEAICPFCQQAPCAIAGCAQPPARIFAHSYMPNRGTTIRNDFWVCAQHAPLIAAYRRLRSQGRVGCLAPLAVGSGIVIAAKNLHSPWQAAGVLVAFMLALGLAIWLFSRADRFAREQNLVKRRERALPMANGTPADQRFD